MLSDSIVIIAFESKYCSVHITKNIIRQAGRMIHEGYVVCWATAMTQPDKAIEGMKEPPKNFKEERRFID